MIVHTQAELDAALAAGEPSIHIDSPAGVWLTLRDLRVVASRGPGVVASRGPGVVVSRGPGVVVMRKAAA